MQSYFLSSSKIFKYKRVTYRLISVSTVLEEVEEIKDLGVYYDSLL